MSEIPIAIRVRPYDQICPLLLGDVTIPGAKARFELHGRLETDFPESLRGKRVGTHAWSDTGTLWARAAMRDHLQRGRARLINIAKLGGRTPRA